MSVIITDQASTIEFLFSTGDRKILDKDNLNIKEENNVFSKWLYISNAPGFVQTAENDVIKLKYSEVTSPAVASNQALIDLILGYKASSGYTIGDVRITDGTNVLSIENNNSMPVTLQDQTTPTLISPISQLEQSTITTASVAIGDREVTVDSVTGISNGKIITLFNPTSIRFMIARCVGAPVGNVVTLDRLFDFAYPSGSYVDVSEANLAIDGSTTPIVCGVRNNAGAVPPPGIDLTVDITRIVFQCITTALPELDMFGDIVAGLTNGLFCRRRDDVYSNIFNAQTNGELAGIMYDLSIYEAAKFGVNGFIARLTFAGQNKLGVAVRLAINEDLEVIIQDDLSSLLRFTMVAEGSIVEP